MGSGVIVVSDVHGLTSAPDAHLGMEELLSLLVVGKKSDPSHPQGWVLKVNSQTWDQLVQRSQHDAVVQRVLTVLKQERFMDQVFQVMTKSEESSKPVPDPPKPIRDAVKTAFHHRHNVRCATCSAGSRLLLHIPLKLLM